MSSGSEVVAAARIAPDSACTRPRNVNADRFIRPGLRSGSVRVCAQSRQYDSARSRKVTTASASPVTTRMRSVRPGTSSWAR
ncbi:Uncharacterised protein [Mycobacteroides abscessus subsp. abscessus]|nr:Uncharacterised protein [Mycobacteroides abscessus subsp. abscessus]